MTRGTNAWRGRGHSRSALTIQAESDPEGPAWQRPKVVKAKRRSLRASRRARRKKLQQEGYIK